MLMAVNVRRQLVPSALHMPGLGLIRWSLGSAGERSPVAQRENGATVEPFSGITFYSTILKCGPLIKE